MGLFGFGKRRKRGDDIPLPPPPQAPLNGPKMQSDIPDMVPAAPPAYVSSSSQSRAELPALPPLTDFMDSFNQHVELPIDQEEPSEAPRRISVFVEESPRKQRTEPMFTAETHDASSELRVSRESLKPLFVGENEYKELLDNARKVRNHALAGEDMLKRLQELQSAESAALEKWHSVLEDTEKKLAYVDTVIARAQS